MVLDPATLDSPDESSHLEHVSDTALIVARIRGRESTRADRLFNDALAFRLAGERGEQLGQASRKRWVSRLVSKSLEKFIVLRTALIDEVIESAVRDHGITCVVNLGAGLDARPYRLNLPANLHWIEVDFPDLIAQKSARVGGETPRCRLERRGLDLRDPSARAQLFESLNTLPGSLLVLTEGLLLYLDESDVAELAKRMLGCANIKRWVTDLNSPHALDAMERVWRFQLGKELNFRFGHDSGRRFFADRSWQTVQEIPILEQGRRFHRAGAMSALCELTCQMMGASFSERVRHLSVLYELSPLEQRGGADVVN